MKAMGRLREGQRQKQEEWKERLKKAWRRMRVFLRRLEREWWEERIKECEAAFSRGRVDDMYAILN